MWNDALISRQMAGELAGAEPVTWQRADGGGLVLRHTACGQSCGLWTHGQPTSPDDILSGVLRHLVTAHDLPLNRAARDRRARERANPGGGPGGDGDGGAHPAAPDRPGPGPGRGPDDLGAEPGAGGDGGADPRP